LKTSSSATAYSPRLVLWIARDPVVSHAIGVFTATFLYALSALVWVDRGGSGRVPLAGILVVGFLLIISVIMFIGLIQRVSMLQVNRMLIFTGDQGRDVIENLYPPIDTLPSPDSAELPRSPCLQTLLHHGDPRLVQAANISRLVDIASKFGCIIELMVTVGDAVLDSVPIMRVYGAASAIPEETLRPTITFGSERTFEQDPKYATRHQGLVSRSQRSNYGSTGPRSNRGLVNSTGPPSFGNWRVSRQQKQSTVVDALSSVGGLSSLGV